MQFMLSTQKKLNVSKRLLRTVPAVNRARKKNIPTDFRKSVATCCQVLTILTFKGILKGELKGEPALQWCQCNKE